MAERPVGTILTVGYEGRTVASLIETLKRARTQIVIDIRKNPFSRKPRFSKNALADALLRARIRYVHVGELGSPRPLREALKQNGDETSFFTAFRKYLLTKKTVMKSLVADTAGHTVCLLCFEKDYTKCHRSVVAEKLANMSGRKVENL